MKHDTVKVKERYNWACYDSSDHWNRSSYSPASLYGTYDCHQRPI